MDMPADWAMDKAEALIDEVCGKGFAGHKVPAGAIRQFARYIEAHEQPPVDPDLVTAREICAGVAGELDRPDAVKFYRAGDYDNEKDVQFALAKLKEARGK